MRFEVYRRRTLFPSQRYGWRLIAANNEIVAASSEGFSSESGARSNAMRTHYGLRVALPGAVMRNEVTELGGQRNEAS